MLQSSGHCEYCTILVRWINLALLLSDKFACQEAIHDYLIERRLWTTYARNNMTSYPFKGMFHIEEDREYVSPHEYEWFERSESLFRDIFNLT